MSDKQARLVAAIADAMEAQGISQNTLGRKSGVAQSMISAAILGKYELKEEKWRLLCEALGLDYDQIVDAPEAETPHQSAEETRGVRLFSLVKRRSKKKTSSSTRKNAICWTSLRVTLPAI